MAKVFISYNRRSEEVARSLAADVDALGHTVWLDQELSGGQVWWERILATIRDCDVFVFVLDPESLSSTACQREYGYAGDLGKAVLPVLAADGISTNLLPPVLSQIQFVDYRKKDRDAVLKLARAFTAVPASKPLPNPLPPAPDVPLSYLGGVTERVDRPAILTYEEQSALIVDLRRAVRDPEMRADAMVLLRRLRKRRDLLAAVADEVDDVLRAATNPPDTRPIPEPLPPPLAGPVPAAHVPAPAPVRPDGTPERRKPVVPPDADHGRPRAAIPPRSRLIGAAVSAAIASVVVLIVIGTAGTLSAQREWPAILGLYVAPPWALIGAIAAGRARVVQTALALALAGLVAVWWIFAAQGERDALLLGAIFGAAPGALAGAIAGILWARRKKLIAVPAA